MMIQCTVMEVLSHFDPEIGALFHSFARFAYSNPLSKLFPSSAYLSSMGSAPVYTAQSNHKHSRFAFGMYCLQFFNPIMKSRQNTIHVSSELNQVFCTEIKIQSAWDFSNYQFCVFPKWTDVPASFFCVFLCHENKEYNVFELVDRAYTIRSNTQLFQIKRQKSSNIHYQFCSLCCQFKKMRRYRTNWLHWHYGQEYISVTAAPLELLVSRWSGHHMHVRMFSSHPDWRSVLTHWSDRAVDFFAAMWNLRLPHNQTSKRALWII